MSTTVIPPVAPPTPLPANDPAVLAHISMLQAIIARLAGNSAACKTGSLSLAAAIFALYGVTKNLPLLAVGFVQLFIFAVLDALYLTQERLFRDLFGDIAEKLRSGNYTAADLFRTGRSKMTACAVVDAFCSWSVGLVYFGVFVAGAVIYLVVRLVLPLLR